MQMRPQHKPKPKKKASDLVISQKLRELVPESQAYMDLLSFERKLDSTIMRKRLDIQVNIVTFKLRGILIFKSLSKQESSTR